MSLLNWGGQSEGQSEFQDEDKFDLGSKQWGDMTYSMQSLDEDFRSAEIRRLSIFQEKRNEIAAECVTNLRKYKTKMAYKATINESDSMNI